MNTHADKKQEKKSQSVANTVSINQSGSGATFQFVDNRPEAIAQRKLQKAMNNRLQAKKIQLEKRKDNTSPADKQKSREVTKRGFGFVDNRAESQPQMKLDYKTTESNRNNINGLSVQMHPMNVVQFSSYKDTAKDNHEIYMIYERRSPQELVQYVGRTNQGINTRFEQHKKSKTWLTNRNCGIQKLTGGNWTKFEVATHEQYWILEAGGKAILENSINGITNSKYVLYRTPKNSAWNTNQELGLWNKSW